MASVFPLMEFARAIAGQRGEVNLLLPPGAEAHTWQPRPSDILRLRSSDLFVCVGSALEPWLDDILRGASHPKLRILQASLGLDLIKDKQGMADPHVWLDFVNCQIIIDRIRESLSEIEPASAPLFLRNAVSYKGKLEELDVKFREGLKNCLQRKIILGGHAAFGYLAKRYNLEQVSLYGLSPDSEPTPRELIEALQLARKNRIKTIYYEVSISNKLAKVMAKEIGAKTLALNPGHNLTKKQLMQGLTFFDIMEENLKNLRDGLICR